MRQEPFTGSQTGEAFMKKYTLSYKIFQKNETLTNKNMAIQRLKAQFQMKILIF